MRLTNKFGLPPALTTAAQAYIGGAPRPNYIRVTELIGAPLVRRLTYEHWDEIEEDVSDRVWAIMGTAVHEVMMKAAHANMLTEERLAVDIGGYTLTGTPDVYEQDGTLTDWKNESVWGLVNEPDGKQGWEQQINCYRWLLEKHGFPVERLQVVVFLRDWSKRKAANEPDYPQQPVKMLPIPRWTMEQTQAYIEERLAAHGVADAPVCTSDERWEKPTTWAVMKNTNVRASRVLPTEDEAQAWMRAQAADVKSKWRIEQRPGEQTRCQFYCRVNQWCSFWQSQQKTA